MAWCTAAGCLRPLLLPPSSHLAGRPAPHPKILLLAGAEAKARRCCGVVPDLLLNTHGYYTHQPGTVHRIELVLTRYGSSCADFIDCIESL
jgi:hypothetical protein